MAEQLSLLTTALSFALVGGLLAMSTYVTLRVGLLSFATVTFAAIGGYAAIFAATTWGVGLPVALLVGTGVGAVAGALVAPLALRLESHWLALSTVALMLVTRVIVVNLDGVTGGSEGTVVPFAPGLLAVLVVVVVVCVVVARVVRTRFGSAGAAAREDPVVAGTLGIPVRRVYVAAFVLSGAIGGLAGVLHAGLLQYVDPDTFYLDIATAALASVVLGGTYHWAGAIIGAMVFTGAPNYLAQYVGQGEAIASGLLLLVIMIWLPGGLVDPVRARRRRERRRTDAPASAHAATGAAAATDGVR